MKILQKQLNKRIATIVALLKTPRRKYTSATFHKLRVEIKKLNALLDLVNFCAADFKRKKTFEPFQLIFRQAGKIREIQLEEALLKTYLPNPESWSAYRKSLKTERLQEQACFFTMVNDTLIARLKRKYHKIATHLDEVSPKKANNYLEKKKNKIQKLLVNGAVEAEQAHELRKRLKVLQYTVKSLSPGEEKPLKKDVLPELLGKWHDCQVIARNLEKVIGNGGTDPQELKQLKKIKREMLSESNKLFEQINTAIQASEFFAGDHQTAETKPELKSNKPMKSKTPEELKDGDPCTVVGGTHTGKSGIVRDINTSKTGHITITVEQENGVRFKTLAKNVAVQPEK